MAAAAGGAILLGAADRGLELHAPPYDRPFPGEAHGIVLDSAPWPLLGDGIVRDTIAFIAFYGIARAVTIRRGLSVPGILNASFLRATV